MKNIAIVVVAFNRVNSLSRLLKSITQAEYYGKKITLIISIDNSGSDEVASYARDFKWPFGEKEVIQHPKRLGLRDHVLYCGNLTNNYDAVVMLEDDLFISKNFIPYVYQSIEKYDSCDHIAGISLYTHLWNVGIHRPFVPQNNGSDAYFLQYAQSWGQVWTKRMWSQFYEWYLENDDEFIEDIDLPNSVVNWPESSWLKYYIRYIVKTNRYFVYPYVSLTTNFTDPGTHNSISNTSFQVPLLSFNKETYNLPDFTKDTLKYDVFFEQENLGSVLNLSDEEICVDLYGDKNNIQNKRFWLTTKLCNYKIIKKFPIQLRPHELNVLFNLKGEGIYLYDTYSKESNLTTIQGNYLKISEVRYDVRAISNKSLLRLLSYEILQFFKRKLIPKRTKNKNK